MAMGKADEWRRVRDAIRETGGIDRSPHVAKLYALAVADAQLAQKKGVASEETDDLVHDVLAGCLSEILEKASPRAFFLTALRNRATDAHRKRQRRPEASLDLVREPAVASSVDARRELREAFELLRNELSPRDFEVFIAVTVYGEAVAEIARLKGVTDDNVYQIVHRARVRLKEMRDADS